MDRVLAVIPARYASSRFPGKALADLDGAPLVVRVAERATRMKLVDNVIVATDDERIRAAVTDAGFECELTATHPTGTDRVGEVARRHHPDIVVNLQGDEPLLDPADGDRLVMALRESPDSDWATLGHPLAGPAEWRDPHVVKVLVDQAGNALYFSRAAVPGHFPGGDDADAGADRALRHVGIYAFRGSALLRFLASPRTPLELTEGLEQLRALEHGLRVKVVTCQGRPVGVDTPADLERVRRLWQDEN